MGDVMGHGMEAAARMGQLRAVLTAYAFDGDLVKDQYAFAVCSKRPKRRR